MKTKAAKAIRNRGGVPVQYVLPPDLIRMVKLDALERGSYQSHVVLKRLQDSFKREPVATPSS